MTDNHPTIAFLVVCWNNKNIIEECINSINEQTVGHKQIYIMDNASSDGSASYIRGKYPEVRLIASDKNNGFARGNNILIQECLKNKSITYVALVNSDAVLEKKWTEEILKGIKGKNQVACVQGTTLDYYDHRTIDSQHIYLRNDFQSVQYGYMTKYDRADTYPRRVFGVNAAAALYSREFIESQPKKVLFDERFYMYLEDMDVAFRSVLGGWKNYYIPSAKAYHMGSASSKKRASGYNIYMTYRNQAALLAKNAPLRILLKFLPHAIMHDIRFYRHLRQQGDKEFIRQIVKGRLVGIVRAPLYLNSRFKIMHKRRITNEQLERVMMNEGIFR
jgi:GT2 family glycosyltransferase